jgi:hypothetical protein
MSSRKSNSLPVSSSNSTNQQLDAVRRALEWIVDKNTFADLGFHGNTKWLPNHLVCLAIISAWNEANRLTDAFDKATRQSQAIFGVLAIATYQGMMRALVTASGQLIPRLWLRIQTLMETVAPSHFRVQGWLPLAVDGSRFSVPRTKSNEQAFRSENFGHGRNARSRHYWKNKRRRSKPLQTSEKPLIWLTLVWHMGLKLPWCWKPGRSSSSEQRHLTEMLEAHDFPGKTLLCCDAGFAGYQLWSTIIQKGHHILVRVGANVHLLKGLAKIKTGDGIVCLWPEKVAARNEPPLVLRLIELQNERGRIYLITDVLSESALRLSTIRKLYPLRWGIEIQLRSVKQTFGRGKLRSRNAAFAVAELEWSLLSLTMLQLLAIREQTKINSPPERSSVAQALTAIRFAIEQRQTGSVCRSTLSTQLREAIKDDYHRRSSKKGRYYPDAKDKPSKSPPRIVPASRRQKQKYAALMTALKNPLRR